jgi:hypothetical protein
LGAWTEVLLKPAYDERGRAKKQFLVDLAAAKRSRGRPGGAPQLRLAAPPPPADGAAPGAEAPTRRATFGAADGSAPEGQSRRATFEAFEAFDVDAAIFQAFDTASGVSALSAEPPRSPIQRPPALGLNRAPQSARYAQRGGAIAFRAGAKSMRDVARACVCSTVPRSCPPPIR